MNLLFFILGMLFINFINPILDEICNFILTVLETKKGEYAVKIAEYNKKVNELKQFDDEKDEPLQIMGFQYPIEAETDNDIEEEEDDEEL